MYAHKKNRNNTKRYHSCIKCREEEKQAFRLIRQHISGVAPKHDDNASESSQICH